MNLVQEQFAPAAASAQFVATAWDVIRRAAGPLPEGAPARQTLCQTYWYPIYAFLRRQNFSPADAEDTTQSFFVWLLESNVIERADAERGRFRAFLVTALKQFASRERQYRSAAKRSPVRQLLSLDADEPERRFSLEPSHVQTADRQFDRAWAMEFLRLTMERLEEEWRMAGRSDRFDALKDYFTGGDTLTGRELADRLGMSEGAARVALHRLKHRYGELLREAVAATVAPGDSVDDELRSLMAALGS